MTRITVRKTRVMIAIEVAEAVGADEWEREQFARLSMGTLEGLARRVLPVWSRYATVLPGAAQERLDEGET